MDRPGLLPSPGVSAALGAALLFGTGTPLAKLILSDVSPWLLAGLFYLGSGIGLTAVRLVRRAAPVRLARQRTCRGNCLLTRRIDYQASSRSNTIIRSLPTRPFSVL